MGFRLEVTSHVRSATALQAAAMAAGGLLFGGLGTPGTGRLSDIGLRNQRLRV